MSYIVPNFGKNSLTPEWLAKFTAWNRAADLIVYDGRYWVGVINIKWFHGQPDPKYNYPIIDHTTYFAKQGVASPKNLMPGPVAEMNKIQAALFDVDKYMYWNSSQTRSITRLHFHAIKWG